MSLLPWRSAADDAGCGCRPTFTEPTGTGVRDRVELHVDAADCNAGGDLATSPACRATVVEALTGRDADAVQVHTIGRERTYCDEAAGLLLAAGRFASLVEFHDADLAARATVDPFGAAREATGRAGPVGRLVAETGLAAGAAGRTEYEEALRCHVGPVVAQSRVDTRPPRAAELLDATDLPTGATVREYALPVVGEQSLDEAGESGDRLYHLEPAEAAFDDDAYRTLAAAVDRLVGDGPLPPSSHQGVTKPTDPASAVHAVAGVDAPVGRLTSVLRKHTAGNGVLDDLFADDRVSDVYVTAPAPATPVRVVVDGRPLPTNVRLTPTGVGTLASRLRRTSGRAFSRATPCIDASLSMGPGEESVRAAGVTRPLADGPAFAFRRHDESPWTLARLVATDSLTPRAAGLLSLAVERGAAGLVAGARGAGKTTTLGALLWALPRSARTVVVEDTPELPIDALQSAGRDVQGLRVARGDAEGTETTPRKALRTALRLGDGAIVVGEVRGDEARVLYEAMRVGGAANAVLGTVHGDGAAAVRTRLTEDLGVSDRSFATTDFVLTMADTAAGRRAVAIEEVTATDRGSILTPLFDLDADGHLTATATLDRGESALLDGLAEPAETYGEVLAVLDTRSDRFESLAEHGATEPAEVRAFGAAGPNSTRGSDP